MRKEVIGSHCRCRLRNFGEIHRSLQHPKHHIQIGDALLIQGLTEQTYYRWRKEYGGLKVDQAKRFKELELENARLNLQLMTDYARELNPT